MKSFIKFLIITLLSFLLLFITLFIFNLMSNLFSEISTIAIISLFVFYVVSVFFIIIMPIVINMYKFNKKQLHLLYKDHNRLQNISFFKNSANPTIDNVSDILLYLNDLRQNTISERQHIHATTNKIEAVLTELNFIFIKLNKAGNVVKSNKIFNDYFKKIKQIQKIIPHDVFNKIINGEVLSVNTKHKINSKRLYIEWIVFIDYDNEFDVSIYLIGKDQSKRKNLEFKIIDMKKFDALGRVASGLSHDFKNYLTCINGYLELLEESKSYDSEIIEAALKTGNNAFKLVEQISSFSKSSTIFFEDFSLEELYNNTKQIVKSLINEQVLIKIENNIDKDIKLTGDKDKLLQVILNLVINAKDAILQNESQRGMIQIIFNLLPFNKIHTIVKNNFNLQKNNYVKIEIIDDGMGIPLANVQRIFEPFYTTKKKGTGLGLSIVLGIIKKHYGALEISTKKSEGTRIFLYLPTKQDI